MSVLSIISNIVAVLCMLGVVYNTDVVASDQNAMVTMLENMKFDALGKNEVEELKKLHDKVMKGIYSIPPKIRKKFDSFPLITTSRKNLDETSEIIKDQIREDLEIDKLPTELDKKIDRLIKYGKVTNSLSNDYLSIDISGDAGGTSIIRLGLLSFQSIDDDQVVIGLSLYCEEWKEESYVYINKSHETWSFENVKGFLLYNMIEKLDHKIAAAKRKTEL